MMMPNEPEYAKEKLADPGLRRNAQGHHEGSAHTSDEFDAKNAQKKGLGTKKSAKQRTKAKDK